MHLIRQAGTSTRGGLGSTSAAASSRLDRHSSVALPVAVWRWFADCLSEGDGQPLQKLALGALSRLLSSADPTTPEGREVSELLCSRAFLRPFLRALAHNHKKQATEGGAAGAEQWSLGVKEVLHDAGRGDTRELVIVL